MTAKETATSLRRLTAHVAGHERATAALEDCHSLVEVACATADVVTGRRRDRLTDSVADLIAFAKTKLPAETVDALSDRGRLASLGPLAEALIIALPPAGKSSAPAPAAPKPAAPAPAIGGSPSRGKPAMPVGTPAPSAPATPASQTVSDAALISACHTAFGRKPASRLDAEKLCWSKHVSYAGSLTDAEAEARGWRRLDKSKSGPCSIAISQQLMGDALKAHAANSAKPAIDPTLTGRDRFVAAIRRDLNLK